MNLCESPITCNDTENRLCSIRCEEYGCTETTFICDSTLFDCNILCMTEESCSGMNIISSINSSNLNITCLGINSCQYMTINSSSNELSVNCESKQSCKDMTISTNSLQSDIKCQSQQSCQKLIVSAISNNINSINLQCLSSSSIASCIDVNFYCNNIVYGVCKSTCNQENNLSVSCENNYIHCNQNNKQCISSPNNGLNIFNILYPTPKPTKPIESTPKYIIINQRLSWHKAEQFCFSNFGTNLATITNYGDFYDINNERNVSLNLWIGLNKIDSTYGWQWQDASSCQYIESGKCEDDARWAFDESQSPFDCAAIFAEENGDYMAMDCTNKYQFVCNLISYDEYVCIKDNNDELFGVMKYDNPYKYILDGSNFSGNIFELYSFNDYWSIDMKTNNDTKLIGNCSNQYIVSPFDCYQWNWYDNKYKDFKISKCHFNNICSANITGIFEFVYWDYIDNGAVYYNADNDYYIYPEQNINNTDDIGQYIIGNDTNIIASCLFDNNSIFDINQCQEWLSQYGSIFRLNTDCSIIPSIPITTLPTESKSFRFYLWYNMYNQRGYWGTDKNEDDWTYKTMVNATLLTINQFNINVAGTIYNWEYCAVIAEPDVVEEEEDYGSQCILSYAYNVDSTISTYFALANFDIISSDINHYILELNKTFLLNEFRNNLSKNIDILINKKEGPEDNEQYFNAIKIEMIEDIIITTTTTTTTSIPTTTVTKTDMMTTISSMSTGIVSMISNTNKIVSVLMDDGESSDSETVNVLNDTFQFATFGIIFIFSIIIIIAYIYSTFIKINNFFRVAALISVAIHSMDMLSDIFFSVQATLKSNQHSDDLQMLLICILSINFIFLPLIATIFQLYHEMQKHWLKRDKLRAWFSDNTALIYFISIITGSSFSAVELFNSNLFGLSQFDMGLNKKDLMSYRTKRMYSIVMLENVPQLILQIWYLLINGTDFNFIIGTSLLFTIISVIVAIISMIIQKQILFNQDLVIIEFKVCGGVVISRTEFCRNHVTKLRDQLANILGLNKQLIEIIRPENIPNGLIIHANIHININGDGLENVMINAMKSGQLTQIIMNSWKLTASPIVSDLVYKVETSKMKKKRLHSLKHDRIEVASISTPNSIDDDDKNQETDVAVPVNVVISNDIDNNI